MSSKQSYRDAAALNTWIEKRNEWRGRLQEKKMGLRHWWPYFIAIPVDFINTFNAVMLIFGGESKDPTQGIIIATGVAVVLGLWAPYRAGNLLKDGIYRQLLSRKIIAWVIVAGSALIITAITIVRFNAESDSSGGIGALLGDQSLDTAKLWITLVLTGIMVITFLISMINAYEHRNYFRKLYLQDMLALLHEEERNANLRATLAELQDIWNDPDETIIKASETHKKAILNDIDTHAVSLMEHCRARLTAFLGNPDVTTTIGYAPPARIKSDEEVLYLTEELVASAKKRVPEKQRSGNPAVEAIAASM